MYFPKISHEHKLLYANNVLHEYKKKSLFNLLGLAIYGSTGRNEDSVYSDIEILVIIDGSGVELDVEGLKNGLKYEINIKSLDIIKNDITNIDIKWSIRNGAYFENTVLYEKQNCFKTIKEWLSEIQKSFTLQVYQKIFFTDIYEQFGKLWASFETKKEDLIRYISLHVFNMLVNYIGLINKFFFKGVSSQVFDALNLPINFPSFYKIGHLLLKNDSIDIKELERHYTILFEILLRFLDIKLDFNYEFTQNY